MEVREFEKNLGTDDASVAGEVGIFESLADSMVCDPASKLVSRGFTATSSAENIVLFINAGASISKELKSGVKFLADKFFVGGNTFQTEEFITGAGDCFFIYQSARLGNFCYRVENLSPGDYVVDLHFVEMINILGPKGMRVFNVYMQEEKVLDNFDIYSVVGSNKPLQLVDSRVFVKDDGVLLLQFEEVLGSPIVSAICIRRAPKASAPHQNRGTFVCKNCSTESEYPLAPMNDLRMKSIAKYEKTVQDLKDTLKKKTDECYQSWMSWTSANEELEKTRTELFNKTFHGNSLEQSLEEQSEKLKDVSAKYEHDKRSWTMAINGLEHKVKAMKRQHSQLSRDAHDCIDSIPDLSKMVFSVQTLVEQCDHLKMKCHEEQMKRRRLHNELQEAKGNIRVFCRCRPLAKAEIESGCTSIVDFDAAKDGELGIHGNGSSTKKAFKFDRVYTPKDDQVEVFSDAAPMIISVLDGYNICIFAYGQTGTGKTFTMEGTKENRGVNYRTLEELFNVANERAETYAYTISVSVLEVYNEQIRDLLATETSRKLEIKQDPEGLHNIPGVVEAKVENIKQVWNVLQQGSRARAVGSNSVNEHSSRSHCMLCVMVKAKNLLTEECTKSKLWLVDLAGSERLAKTDVQGDRLKEAQNINRSLSALGDVISALANKSSHIPYRGDSKTLMFVQISPSDQDLSETLSSLNFATRVRGVELGPARKQVDTSELQKTKTMLEKARQESRSKEEALKKLEDNLHLLENKNKSKDQIYKSQLDKIRELENQLELKASIHLQFEKQVSLLSEKLKLKDTSCSNLQQEMMELESKLKEKDVHSAAYQNKVLDLEKELTEQIRLSEASSLVLQNKINELEGMLREQKGNSELTSQSETKVEDKVHEEQPVPMVVSRQSNCSILKPPLSRDKTTEHRILRSLNSARRASQGPAPVNESEFQSRKKRLSGTNEFENRRFRLSDPPKAAPTTMATAQRAMVNRLKTAMDRDPAQGIKEKENKKRIWSR